MRLQHFLLFIFIIRAVLLYSRIPLIRTPRGQEIYSNKTEFELRSAPISTAPSRLSGTVHNTKTVTGLAVKVLSFLHQYVTARAAKSLVSLWNPTAIRLCLARCSRRIVTWCTPPYRVPKVREHSRGKGQRQDSVSSNVIKQALSKVCFLLLISWMGKGDAHCSA